MKQHSASLLCLTLTCCLPTLSGQDFSGLWDGYLVQDGSEEKYTYQLDLDQTGDALIGTSYSVSPDGKSYARFEITGYIQGTQLVLQEIKQLEPKSPWCLKNLVLDWEKDHLKEWVTGTWRADGCVPGISYLVRQKGSTGHTFTEKASTPGIEGKWVGTLSQSDRDYGFYFTVDVQAKDKGQSYIVSEANGGSATMHLNWTYESKAKVFQFTEVDILNKTDPKWRWCIKSGTLRYREEKNRLVLEGEWSGYIEGYTMETGSCASGSLYLEKPLPSQEALQSAAAVNTPYESESKRKVEVVRVLEVKSPNIKIKVWDNGTVDGDVATLFLNGSRILNQHRVTKHRMAIPVKLEQENNFLILHAEDLGDISPNTVAVSVDDGEREQIIILSSNLNESGAVMIRQFKF
ncbi:MAG TPA: hypothetical protein PKA00_12485 [Saprospiraceae bacterium]|nr:hypothetical protein [Saprospiraceae bacterium]HMQ83725.1 hypothetical protein [Saprospiraceae bacterium]